MKTGRFFLVPALTLFLYCLQPGTAFAGFGFGGGNAGKSGLDFSSGYDVNTVAEISGKVGSLPDPDDSKHAIIGINANGRKYYLYVGPYSYWNKSGISLRINDEISAKGSIAQGNDGRVYMLAQKLVNRTTGDRMELRGKSGEPYWSGRNRDFTRHGGSFFGWRGGRSGMTGMGRGMMGRGMMGR